MLPMRFVHIALICDVGVAAYVMVEARSEV